MPFRIAYWALIGALSLSTSPPAHATEAHLHQNCSEPLQGQKPLALARSIAADSAQKAETDLRKKGFSKREAKGYAILIAAMVGSAATTTYLTASLPDNLHFLSQFVAQVSTLGVYVFGAPIWEPLSSGFRKMAFGVRGQHEAVSAAARHTDEFEALWRRTQENYSLNAQMSRNTITQFIISVQQNFYEAHRAVHSDNATYAADQIAEAAFRLRTLFREISPSDPSVAQVVRTAFTLHVNVDDAFVSSVLERIQRLDPAASQSEAKAYYDTLLDSWLSK